MGSPAWPWELERVTKEGCEPHLQSCQGVCRERRRVASGVPGIGTDMRTGDRSIARGTPARCLCRWAVRRGSGSSRVAEEDGELVGMPLGEQRQEHLSGAWPQEVQGPSV